MINKIDAILSLYKKGEHIDLLTVTDYLRRNGKLESVGGAYYLTSLSIGIVQSIHIETHIKILQEHALKRNVIKACSEGLRSAYNLEEDAFDVYEKVQSSLDTYLKEILRYEIQKVEIIHKKLIKESIRILDEGGQSGVPSGLNLLD